MLQRNKFGLIADIVGDQGKRLIKANIKKSHSLMARDYKGFGNQGMTGVRCIQVGVADLKGRDSIKRVYSPKGKSPTLTTCGGGHREPKVAVVPLDKHKSNSGMVCVGGLAKTKRWLEDGKNLQRNFSQGERIYSDKGKSPTLASNSGGTAGVGNTLITSDTSTLRWRKLVPIECERLQTVPDNYTARGIREDGKEVPISNTQRYKMLGNGWTVATVKHILKSLYKED